MIPLTLVKIAASVLCKPLPNAINNSVSKGILPDNAKIAMVRHSTEVLLIRMIYRIFDQLVFEQRSQKYVKELLKN